MIIVNFPILQMGIEKHREKFAQSPMKSMWWNQDLVPDRLAIGRPKMN